MASVLYATVADLEQVLDGTDAGTGTASQLSSEQLTLALQAASNRVSIYAGGIFDGSTAAATPPDIFHDLTLDLAAFWATKTYLKHKSMDAQHPVWLAYSAAMDILKGFRDGTLRPDVQVFGSVGNEGGTVINRIPNVFTGRDSNTRVSPFGTGGDTLEADVPDDMFRSGWDLDQGGLL